MKIEVNHSCTDFDSYRAARVKSLFNCETGAEFLHLEMGVPGLPPERVGVEVECAALLVAECSRSIALRLAAESVASRPPNAHIGFFENAICHQFAHQLTADAFIYPNIQTDAVEKEGWNPDNG